MTKKKGKEKSKDTIIYKLRTSRQSWVYEIKVRFKKKGTDRYSVKKIIIVSIVLLFVLFE